MSLPRLDFYALTHNAAKWPLPGKVLLGCALAGLVLAAADLVLLSPLRERLSQVQAQEEVLRRQLAEKTALAAGLEAKARQFQHVQKNAEQLLQQLPGESEMPGLLEDIARLALANGLVVESVTPLDERPQAFYVEQPVQVGVTGNYHDLATFVSTLGGLSRMTTVHDVALQRDGALLRLDLLARTYWLARPGATRGRPVAQAPSFVYDAGALRDPFQPLAMQVDRVPLRAGLAPDLARSRGLLEGLAVDQFEMVGTLSRGTQTFALLRAASTVYRLAVGDYLGRDHGRVTAIDERHLELVELFPDEQGAWLERPRTLVLNVNS
ncbi:Pilus assembly protein, PilO [Pseudomonas sp. 22 E 5]|jgi:type IV pilus assembly protein PilOP|uniref:pilus assembly protein PilP n=1 Tax=Pseudomonas TaxID=286 RepID=UPI0002E14085|nr:MULTISPECIES: pilus assembly protein PilP [Pseudomonas]MCX9152129.1 pilus assembly protein PilP [Pseudomonas sp. TB1-B1]CRM48792.1 Pilus assembly protein, PilO [Pseudomonas sp. 31 E 6]CRM68278.1 Pilus assembly protein, PilO [Pseudomonas sp. 31 E 5]CRM92604.1 Pilus assembly protein, PilO [Pseudomonas sp. 22 E 5]